MIEFFFGAIVGGMIMIVSLTKIYFDTARKTVTKALFHIQHALCQECKGKIDVDELMLHVTDEIIKERNE